MDRHRYIPRPAYRVTAWMAALAAASGQHLASEAYLVELTGTLVDQPRPCLDSG